MIYTILLLQDLNSAASETLRELSPWAYVIVVFAMAVAGTFMKMYLSEKKKHDELEKEFRTFMSESLTQQIEVSKDVIDLVSRSKDDIRNALNTFNSSDTRVENLISEVQKQLTRIEQSISKYGK